MNNAPLMPKATAVWLVENTSLSFDQIADFCKLHPLEVKGIADGEVAAGIKGHDPITSGQLTRDEIARGEANPEHKLVLAASKVRLPEIKRRGGPRYTPLSRRQDRPNAILWLLRNHPELKDAQIMRLVGTTKTTLQAIRERTHWNSANLSPLDPVTLGLCSKRAPTRIGRRCPILAPPWSRPRSPPRRAIMMPSAPRRRARKMSSAPARPPIRTKPKTISTSTPSLPSSKASRPKNNQVASRDFALGISPNCRNPIAMPS
mgnify:CR=1 FL=1